MAYNDTPQANQRISDTQPLIRSNFAQIQTALSVNHIGIADVSGDQGKHKFVQFVQQVAAPATSATELDLYTKAVAGSPQMFLRRQSNGVEIDFTSATNGTPGTVSLPSGIIFKWGQFSNPVGGIVTFVSAFPNNCFSVVVTSAGNIAGTVIRVTAKTTANFTCSASPTALDNVGFYLAIGN